jgi:hypothetical protein
LPDLRLGDIGRQSGFRADKAARDREAERLSVRLFALLDFRCYSGSQRYSLCDFTMSAFTSALCALSKAIRLLSSMFVGEMPAW